MDTLDSLCRRYRVDMAHAQQVAALALGLFDSLQAVHHLPARSRELTEAAALLHNVGMSMDVDNHHTAGRDIVLASSLAGFDPAERAAIACAVAFHRKPVQPEAEPVYNTLPARLKRDALAISALVRIADGLDYSQTQTTQIVSVEVDAGDGEDAPGLDGAADAASFAVSDAPASGGGSVAAIRLRVHGPHVHDDAAQAARKADLWNALFAPMTVSGRVTRPGLTTDIGPAEAARRIVGCQLDKLTPEEWVLSTEAELSARRIHRLRATTRRLRSTLRMFRQYFKNKALRPVRRGLRELSRRLDDARECDLLVSLAKSFIKTCDDQARPGVQQLLDAWRDRRRQVRADLARYLMGRAHRRWLDEVRRFAQTGDHDRSGKGRSECLREIAPSMIEERLARVQSYDSLASSPPVNEVHRLRMAVKQLRDAADALREVLPAERADCILARCVEAQDAYGALTDAHTAALRALIYLAEAQPSPAIMSGVLAFAEAQHRLAEGRLQVWRQSLEPILMI